MYSSPGQRKVLNKVMWKTKMGVSSFQSWLKKLGDPENGRCTKVSGFISKIKLMKNCAVMTRKMKIQKMNGLQKNDNKNITFKHKPNKDLDHLVNSLEKGTEMKENKTKTKSQKFVHDADKNIRKKKKRPYQKVKVKLE